MTDPCFGQPGVMTALLLLVVLGTAVWVGVDASGRDFSHERFWPKGTTTWVIGVILLWIVVFPAYLARRGRAPQRA